MKTKEHSITPREVHCLDEDGIETGLWGYWCFGHVDKQKFAIACNKEYSPHDFGEPVYASSPQHARADIAGDVDGQFTWVLSNGTESVPVTFEDVAR